MAGMFDGLSERAFVREPYFKLAGCGENSGTFVPEVTEATENAVHRAKECASYLNGLENGNSYHLNSTLEVGQDEYYPVFMVEKGVGKPIIFDDFLSNNERIAKKTAEEITKETGKKYVAQKHATRFIFANSWIVIPEKQI